MGRVRLILISLVALVVALGAAFVARGIAAPKAPKTVVVEAAPSKPTVQVLTAKRDLTVGERLDASNIEWKSWPEEGLSKAFITDGAGAATAPTETTQKVAAAAGDAAKTAAKVIGASDPGRMAAWFGAVVREPVSAGEPIVERKVVRAGASGVLAVTLQPGMRAMSVPLSAENSAAGFILPGDHVDVVQIRKGVAGVDAGTVMRNVRVLAIDQNTRADPKEAAKVGSQATLELTPSQAEDMVLARAQGDLTLVLRSYADAAGPPRTGDIERLPGEDPVVRVFRDGVETQVKVAR